MALDEAQDAVKVYTFDEALLPDVSELLEGVNDAFAPPPDAVDRGEARYDLQNPGPRSPWFAVVNRVREAVWPLVSAAHLGHTELDTAVGIVPAGEPAQEWHCDLDGATDFFTLLVPLTTEYEAGGTEFRCGLCRLPVRGTAYSFDGGVEHRGGEHRGERPRAFVVFTFAGPTFDAEDPNIM